MPKKKPTKKSAQKKNPPKVAKKKSQKKNLKKQSHNKKFLILEIILAFAIVFGGVGFLMMHDTAWNTLNENFSKIWQIPQAKTPSEPEPIEIPIAKTTTEIIEYLNPNSAFTSVEIQNKPDTLQEKGKRNAIMEGYLILDYTGSETEKYLVTQVLPMLEDYIYNGTLHLYVAPSPNAEITLANGAKCSAKNTDRFFWEYLTHLYDQEPPFTYKKLARANAKTDMSQYFYAKCYQNFHYEDETKNEQNWLTENKIIDSPMLIIDGKIVNPNMETKNIETLIKLWAKEKRPPVVDPDLDSYFQD